MGSSKRLAELYDRDAVEKHLARLLKEAPLQSLTSRELELERLLVASQGQPIDPFDDALEDTADISAAIDELIGAGLAVRVVK